MSVPLLFLAALPTLALAWWWMRRPAPQSVSAAANRVAAPVPAAAPVVGTPAGVSGLAPEGLARFHWRTEEQMEPAKRDRLMAAIRDIPRPPHAMARLLSPEFMAKASSSELSELVMGEPWIAARMLARVNSPIYGLRNQVTDLGQAVTFLGLQSVRAICLQTMMAEALHPTQPGVQKTFDTLWLASSIASELATRLDKGLNLSAPGTLATQVVLSFVGPLATASLIPPTGLSAWLQRDRLARTRLEQDLLGLGASEIGHLLLTNRWSLPTTLADDVRDGGRLLVTAPESIDPERVPRLALAYLSARLGERLALGQLPSLEDYLPAEDDALDMHHLRTCLAHPVLAGLTEVLHSPELQRAIKQMQGAVPAE